MHSSSFFSYRTLNQFYNLNNGIIEKDRPNTVSHCPAVKVPHGRGCSGMANMTES